MKLNIKLIFENSVKQLRAYRLNINLCANFHINWLYRYELHFRYEFFQMSVTGNKIFLFILYVSHSRMNRYTVSFDTSKLNICFVLFILNSRTLSTCSDQFIHILLLVGWGWVPRYVLKSLGTAATLAYTHIITINSSLPLRISFFLCK
jgi:hypothetical protein